VRPYDGQTHVYTHADPDRGAGLAIVARTLGATADDARYEMSFYSGGMGIIDHVAIACAVTPDRVAAATRELRPIEDVLDDDIAWLIDDEDEPHPQPAHVLAARFIEAHRQPFQPACSPNAAMWFAPDSGINCWTVVWQAGDELAYLSFDQG
jgi:hypothetical protein